MAETVRSGCGWAPVSRWRQGDLRVAVLGRMITIEAQVVTDAKVVTFPRAASPRAARAVPRPVLAALLSRIGPSA